MVINSASFYDQSIATVFPSSPSSVSVDLDRNSRISLDSTVFFYCFIIGAEVVQYLSVTHSL